MGYHDCAYCHEIPVKNRFPNRSSGDITLYFESGNSWMMPDMILHYVADHRWQPPQDFVNDVMNSGLTHTARQWTLDASQASQPQEVGYLSDPFEKGLVPDGFVDKLQGLMQQAGP